MILGDPAVRSAAATFHGPEIVAETPAAEPEKPGLYVSKRGWDAVTRWGSLTEMVLREFFEGSPTSDHLEAVETPAQEDVAIAGGVDGTNGSYLFPPLTPRQLAEVARGVLFDPGPFDKWKSLPEPAF